MKNFVNEVKFLINFFMWNINYSFYVTIYPPYIKGTAQCGVFLYVKNQIRGFGNYKRRTKGRQNF